MPLTNTDTRKDRPDTVAQPPAGNLPSQQRRVAFALDSQIGSHRPRGEKQKRLTAIGARDFALYLTSVAFA